VVASHPACCALHNGVERGGARDSSVADQLTELRSWAVGTRAWKGPFGSVLFFIACAH
jgi:hypothetical protein